MKLYLKISGLFILIFLTSRISAQNNNCSFKQTFPVKQGTTIRISNKYGDINVIMGKEDSLMICATVTIVQENNELVKESMKLVNISINKIKDTISVSTLYDKKFFSETIRQGRKSFSVDYLIKMPAYMNLSVSDEFGNISIDELSGTLYARLSQGILSAKKLRKGNEKPISSIFADHVKISIDELNWMNLTLLNCPSVNIDKGQALVITTSVSKIKMGDISSLVSNSKSDSYSIRSIKNIFTESTYSEYEIGSLAGQLKSKATYGSINISDLKKGFSSIDITSSQGRIAIKTGEGVSFRSDIIATDASVEFPSSRYPGIIKTEVNYSTTLVGLAGNDKATKSIITIRATSGKLTIQ
jgi:hypothetical protein